MVIDWSTFSLSEWIEFTAAEWSTFVLDPVFSEFNPFIHAQSTYQIVHNDYDQIISVSTEEYSVSTDKQVKEGTIAVVKESNI